MKSRFLFLSILVASMIIGSAQAATKLRLASQVWLPWVPATVALQKGLMKAEGVDLNIVMIEDYHDMFNALYAGKVDLAFGMTGDVIKARANGKPVKIIAEVDWSHGADKILIAPNLPNLAALKGKKVGADRGTSSYFMLVKALEKVGLKDSDIVLVQMTAEESAKALIAGKIQGAVTWEPDATKVIKAKKGKVAFTSRSLPGIMPEVIFVREDFLNKNRGPLAAFLRGWLKGAVLSVKNRDELFKSANSLNFKKSPLSRPEFEAMFKEISIHNLATIRSRMGAPVTKFVGEYQMFLARKKLAPKKVTVQEVADLKLYQEAFKGMN